MGSNPEKTLMILEKYQQYTSSSNSHFIRFTTILCGATNWEEMHYLAIGEDFTKWLSSYVDLSGGVSSKWTLERVISLIPTATLHPLFAQFRDYAKKIGNDCGGVENGLH